MIECELLIAIPTWPPNVEKREFSRNTWLKRWGNDPRIQYFFYHGHGECDEPDVMWMPCGERYDDSPQKTRLMCRYIRRVYNFQWLFKPDDDTWVHIPRLLDMEKTGDYIGDNHGRRCREQWNNGLNDYAHGGAGYLLSRKAVDVVADKMSEHVYGVEDLVVGNLMHDDGIPLVEDHRFIFEYTDELHVPRPDNDLITVHYVDTPEKRQTIESFWAPVAAK